MTRSPGLAAVSGLTVHRPSVVSIAEVELGLVRTAQGSRLAALAPEGSSRLDPFEGERTSSEGRRLLVGPASPRNLAALRALLPWLSPRPLGLGPSFGFGDRLGMATPGHIRALASVLAHAVGTDGRRFAPIFAQQSIREMERTGRGPAEVLGDAAWGVFAEGWRDGFGADADHLKTPADVDACLAAGYTFFTFDPGAYVDSTADTLPSGPLRTAFESLPWRDLDDAPGAMRDRYGSLRLDLDTGALRIEEDAAVRAAVKYGRAVAHVAALSRHLAARAARSPGVNVSSLPAAKSAGGAASVEIEVSVDETETPTTAAQHAYIALELRRLGVSWVSLAPRFVGRFEKGVDYLGDPAAFEADAAVHAAIARRLGPYKLSLHSGSDKLSVYGALARQAGDLIHVKTAGTSYLEALRTAAALDPGLVRAVYALGRERYEQDRASYHVSASLERAPASEAVPDADLPALLDGFDARQILHVTFGSALARYGDRLRALLRAHPDAYDANVERHFVRHLSALIAGAP